VNLVMYYKVVLALLPPDSVEVFKSFVENAYLLTKTRNELDLSADFVEGTILSLEPSAEEQPILQEALKLLQVIAKRDLGEMIKE
jgi:hypothetical protein